MEKICYNCGKPLTADIATVEHIPAKNLYEGFGDEYKLMRVTVPACFACNNLYSKIDQELRDVLAVKSEDPEQKQDLTRKGIRSILRRSNWTNRTYLNENGEVIAVDFNYGELRQLHIKHFKALFFRKYGFPVPEYFEIEIISDGDEEKVQTAQMLHDYLRENKEFEYSGHPDIFKFILKDITPDIPNDTIYESMDFDKLVVVVGLLVYHDDICAVVVAGKKDFIESCIPKTA